MKISLIRYFVLLLIASSIFTCAKEFPGIDPPEKKFFFPTGGLISPNRKTLFITNGNSDLKYNGSTLLALNLEKITNQISDPSSSPLCKEEPSSNGKFLCELDPDTVLKSVRMDSFAGKIVLFPSSTDSDSGYRLMVATRSNASLIWFDVHTDDNGQVTCLDCGSGCEANFPADCKDSHKIKDLPTDPFRIFYDEQSAYLFVTHLSDPSITVIDTLLDPPEIIQVLSGVMSPSGSSEGGSYDIVKFEDSYYITNSTNSEIVKLSINYSETEDMEYMVVANSYFLQAPAGPFESAYSMRGAAISNDKTKMYVAVKSPPMLVTLDLHKDIETGYPSLEVISQTELPIQPSLVFTHHAPYNGQETVNVVSYPEGEIIVVDPESGNILQYIKTGVGPYELLRLQSTNFDGYIVLNYGESTLSFIDTSETQFKMIGKIGEPNPVGN